MPISTIGIGAAVTPTVVKTTISHYTNRKPRAKKPTAHISYDQGLHLIQSFLLYASHHTVEDVQSFTGQWVPHPTWTRIENVPIPEQSISKAADLLRAQLGEDGLTAVGGTKWWLWRRKNAELKAEWIDMKSDYNQRQKTKLKSRRVMLYVHGGAYFFGSVDEHRYQLQRHARKLRARVFAPRYRLAPQFPFPCGLLDCLAAYVYLLTNHDPAEIIFAGDSAGGGMILSILCLLRDQGMPLPAGAVLISPWVDLTHSFPSLGRDDELDYIPAHGFMQKPSNSWPPPNVDELKELLKVAGASDPVLNSQNRTPVPVQRMDTSEAEFAARRIQPPLSLQLDGKDVVIRDQIQLYTTNELITHPLVSPVLQPSLGGLPPLLIMVGGGERLRDEQIYVAHKAADPQKYRLSTHWRKLYDPDDRILDKYAPTPVQLQVWEDLCHVTPTLSFTRPAKFMYRSIAQFGAWALSRAQNRGIEIMVETETSDSSSSDDDEEPTLVSDPTLAKRIAVGTAQIEIGKAGDPLPAFDRHMIRQQVDRHGICYDLPEADELDALRMSSDFIGVVKEGPIKHWLEAKSEWDNRYSSVRRKIHKQRLEAVTKGTARTFGEGEQPPPSALAGRMHDADTYSRTQKLRKSWGLGMWSFWGSEHDKKTLKNDEKIEKKEVEDEKKQQGKRDSTSYDQSDGVDGTALQPLQNTRSRSRAASRAVVVMNEGQVEGQTPTLPHTQVTGSEQGAGGIPALTISPMLEEEVRSSRSPQMFLPKWKHADHLRDVSRNASEMSVHSATDNGISDSASTRAVFSAAGINTEVHEKAPHTGDDRNVLGNQPSTLPGNMDNLGGYDTPNSRRSIERLQSHQIDLSDGTSMHSSLLLAVQDLSPNIIGRPDLSRNASAMAIVHAEGVIEPFEAQGMAIEPGEVISREHNQNLRDQQVASSNGGSERPGLYDRSNTNFVTAMERL